MEGPYDPNARYKIIRCYQQEGKKAKTVQTGLTLEQAQEHCSNPNSRKAGVYYDAFRRQGN